MNCLSVCLFRFRLLFRVSVSLVARRDLRCPPPPRRRPARCRPRPTGSRGRRSQSPSWPTASAPAGRRQSGCACRLAVATSSRVAPSSPACARGAGACTAASRRAALSTTTPHVRSTPRSRSQLRVRAAAGSSTCACCAAFSRSSRAPPSAVPARAAPERSFRPASYVAAQGKMAAALEGGDRLLVTCRSVAAAELLVLAPADVARAVAWARARLDPVRERCRAKGAPARR